MDHARIEFLRNGFSFVLGGKASIENITPRTLDSILLSVLLGHELVLEPLFSPIASNPLDSGLALPIILFRIYFIHFCQVFRQIFGSSFTLLSAPFLAAASKAINFNLKGFKTFKGFLFLDQQELASAEFM